MKAARLALAVLFALALTLPALAAEKPKKPQNPAPKSEYEQVYAYCKKKYGNGGPLRVVKRGSKWWCYTWG